MAKHTSSKIDTLPADLKAIADEMLEAKFPTPVAERASNLAEAAATAAKSFGDLRTTMSNSQYTRFMLRGMHSGMRYQMVVSRRDEAMLGTREAVSRARRQLESDYREPMEILEAEMGHTPYETDRATALAYMAETLRTDIKMTVTQDEARRIMGLDF